MADDDKCDEYTWDKTKADQSRDRFYGNTSIQYKPILFNTIIKAN